MILNKQFTRQIKRRGLGKEDQMHKSFASLIKGYEAIKKLNCVFWTYNASGEKRPTTSTREIIGKRNKPIKQRISKTASLLKAKGLQPGQADFLFIKSGYGLTWLEFKTETGKQSEKQKEFEAKFKDDYFIVRSVQEGLEILKKREIILD